MGDVDCTGAKPWDKVRHMLVIAGYLIVCQSYEHRTLCRIGGIAFILPSTASIEQPYDLSFTLHPRDVLIPCIIGLFRLSNARLEFVLFRLHQWQYVSYASKLLFVQSSPSEYSGVWLRCL